MRFLPPLLWACTTTLWPAAVLGERNLPATVQVDLLFPRNETYKPVPWFPLVLAVNGLEDVWPFPMSLDMSVISAASELGVGSPSYRNFDIPYDMFINTVDKSPSKTHFLHIPLANITNGTTDRFHVSFELNVLRRCAANGTEIERNWGSGPSRLWKYNLDFSTSPDGKVPDIEEAIKACPEPTIESSVALRVTNIFTDRIYDPGVEHQDQCPVFHTEESAVCPYKDIAAQVAKNVSDTVLKERHCSQGTWQDLMQDCEKKKNMASLFGAKAGTSVFWSVCLILTTLLM